jgi:DNA-binding response OmpR family regulator
MANKMILLVDEDREAQMAMHLSLKAADYDTCFASDALSSLSEARKQQPNAIIIDLGLPAGAGFVAIQQLKRHPSLSVVPIIAVCARDVIGSRERALKAGAKVYLQKPVDITELLAIIRQMVGEPAQPGDSEITGNWKRFA